MSRGICYIDGANVFATTKQRGVNIDWSAFHSKMKMYHDVVEFRYYTAILPEMETGQEEAHVMKLYDWLRYNNYKLITRKAYKRKFQKSDGTETHEIKGNVDVEISVDAVMLAPHYTDTYLFSADGDFSYLLEQLSRIGHQVHVIGDRDYCAQSLRQNINSFVDIESFIKEGN